MTGYVERQPLLPIELQLENRPNLRIEFVVDTGFTDALTLPLQAVTALQLPFVRNETVNLADGSDVDVPVHSATIFWQDNPQEVFVYATGRRPLLGTLLLESWDLNIQFREGGLVTVD
jgi:clan AA aspartic protease